MIKCMPPNHSNTNRVITILIYSDKTLFQNVFVTLVRRVAKDVTSSFFSWHKRYDFNAANFRRRSQSKCALQTQWIKRKRKRSDSVLWQKPLHQQKCQKGKVTTQTTPQKSSIKQRLRTDLGRSVGVTKATQLVWLTDLRAHLPTNRNSRLIKRTHV